MITDETKKDIADYAIAAWNVIRAEVFVFIPGTVSVFLSIARAPGVLSLGAYAERLAARAHDELSMIFEINCLDVAVFDDKGAPSNE